MTTCSSCGAANPLGQRFCGECGAALATTCPSCGAVTRPGQKFCGDCGSALTPAPATESVAAAVPAGRSGGTPASAGPGAVAELRLVSVLFADLVGFTPFSEERDAEEVREVLTRYFDIASDVVRQHGGVVEKFIGDAVMAVWGTPTAREDDAERAVRAGLELVDAVRILGGGLEARAGVMTGEAAVTIGARDQGMVAGDLVNTAARLQAVAVPGTVLVGEATFRTASRAIAFEPAGPQSLKGKVSPVPSWRALRVVAERGGRGRAETLEAPFVGRDDELRLLKELFQSTVRERRARLVSVVGTAGIGKSRLAWEFEKYLDGIVEQVWWNHGRSPSYGDGITFWALGEMIRARAGLAETDDEAATRQRIRELVDRLGFEQRQREWVERALLALLGHEKGIAPEELFGAWRTFFEKLAESGPVVLVFEDLHWADPGTLDFIDHLLEWSRAIPIAIVTLARPELLEKRPTWGAGHRNFMSLFLEPLADSAMRALLAGLIPGLPAGASDAIVARAEGIPLYAVETVRMLVSDGKLQPSDDGTYIPVGDLTALAVPETLTALIAARLDALDATDRGLVLDAAVLGQTFTLAGLAAVAGAGEEEVEPRLRHLVRREIFALQMDPRRPERGQFAFVQALIREVAYNTLTKRDRKARHLAAARYFEGVGTEEIAAALAGHYLAAHANATDGDEAAALAAQARLALVAAADRAAALGAQDQAVTFLTQAMSVARDRADEAMLMERAGEAAAIGARGEDAQRLLSGAIERHRATGDTAGVARASQALARYLLRSYRMEPAVQLIEGALREAAAIPEDPAVVKLGGLLGLANYLADRPREAIEAVDRILEQAERLDLVEVVADALITRGGALCDLRRLHEGLAAVEGGMRLAQSRGLSLVALRSYNTYGVYLSQRDPRAGYAAYREGIAEARRVGARAPMLRLLSNAAEGARLTGDWDWAAEEVDAQLATELDREDRLFFLGQTINTRAWRGEPVADLVMEHAALLGDETDPNVLATSTDVRMSIAMAEGRLADARAACLEMAATSTLNAPAAVAIAGRCAGWMRDRDALARDLDVYRSFGLHGAVVEQREAAMEATLAALDGRIDEARAGFQSALEAARQLGIVLEEAFVGLDMAGVLDPTLPEVASAVERSREILGRLRSGPFLDRLAAVAAPVDRVQPPLSGNALDAVHR